MERLALPLSFAALVVAGFALGYGWKAGEAPKPKTMEEWFSEQNETLAKVSDTLEQLESDLPKMVVDYTAKLREIETLATNNQNAIRAIINTIQSPSDPKLKPRLQPKPQTEAPSETPPEQGDVK